MDEKKDNNDPGDKSFSESAELFEKLYREQLVREAEGQEKVKTDKAVLPPAGLPEKKKAAGSSAAVKGKPFSAEEQPGKKGKPLTAPSGDTQPGKAGQSKETEKEPGIQKGEMAGLLKKQSIETARKVKSSDSLKTPQKKNPVKAKKPDTESPADMEKRAVKEISGKISLKEKIMKRPGYFIYISAGVIFLVIAGLVLGYFGVINIGKITDKPESADRAIIKQGITQKESDIQDSKKEVVPPSAVKADEPEKESIAAAVAPPEKEAVSNEILTPSAEEQKEISADNEYISTKTLPEDQEASLAKETTGAEISDDIQASGIGKTTFSYPYSIYLGSYSNTGEIGKALNIYGRTGLELYYVKIDLGEKGIWFRLYAGFFQTRSEAQKLIDSMQIKDAATKSTNYANLIGAYTSKEMLEEKKASLIQLQYSPYVITEGENNFFLYVGAFYDKLMAEEQNAELASRGIQGRVVER